MRKSSTTDLIDYSKTVQLIYEAGLDFKLWPVALERLADRLGASVSCLVRHDLATSDGTMIMIRTDPDFARLYTEHYAKINIFAQRAGNRPPQTCVTDRMFITKQDLFKTEFYDGFMRPQDVHSLLNVYLLSDGQRGTRIAFGRSPRAGEWEQEQIEQLNMFAPHVYRAALINRQLEFSRLNAEGAVAGLHRLAQGVIVVDAENRPIFVNQAAECILAKADGLVRDARGLATASRAETSRLQRMIAEAANSDLDAVSRSALNVTRPSQRGHYSLLVVPLRLTPGWFLPQRSGAIIFVRDPERAADAPPPDLRQLYGLTPAEAVLVMQIVRSGGLQSAAHNMKIALSTARTHLQRAFQKTGTHRQAELVRLVVEIQAGLTLHK